MRVEEDPRKVSGGSESADDDKGQGVEGRVTLGEAVNLLGGLLDVRGGREGVGVGLWERAREESGRGERG